MNYVKNNLKFLRKKEALTQEQLATKIGVKRAMIGAYEEGRAEPRLHTLQHLAAYFQVRLDDFVNKDLSGSSSIPKADISGAQLRILPVVVDGTDERELGTLVPVKASAGYLLGYNDPEYIEQLQKIKLPFLPTGKHRAFPIKGDSMLPMKDGAYVVAKFVDDFNDIKNGSSYVVVTANDGMTYKRIYDKVEEKGALLLSPDNTSYQSYHVPISEVLELWEFTCSINTQEYDERDLKLSSIIKMFNDLKVELETFVRN